MPRVIATLAAILARGREAGVFTRDCGALDVHFMISGLCFFRVSNCYTFSAIFQCDLSAPEVRPRHKAMIVEMVLAWLRSGGDGSEP